MSQNAAACAGPLCQSPAAVKYQPTPFMSVHVLIVQTGKHKGKRIRIADPEVLIGRDEGAKIRVASTDISRQHCILIPQENGVLVRDLGSRNGTFINGQPIQGEWLMEPGDTLTVGPMALQLAGGPAKKKTPGTILPRKPKDIGDGKLSDDDISSWLSEDNPEIGASDTTIIPGNAAKLANVAKTPKPSPRRRDYKSVAEEAQDIIRQHLESLDK